jgi:chemotaxis protein methyltransferase CheR
MALRASSVPAMTAPTASALDDGDFALSTRDFELIASIAKEQAGIIIRAHKSAMIRGRLMRRLRVLQLRTVAEYCELLRGPQADSELPQLLNVLTTNHTAFFRERHHFDHLKSEALPETIERAQRGAGRIRIWCAASSTGEEPYSLAGTVFSVAQSRGLDTKILATDIDTDVLNRAEKAEYPREVVDRSPADLRPLLQVEPAGGDLVRVGAPLRKLLSFKQLNLVTPWPMKGPFDAIFCRNVMIYFDAPTKKSIVDRSVDMLRPGGWLYLGHSESLSPPHPAFDLIGRTIYRRR